MALSHPRIEGPIWLSPEDITFLRAQIANAEHQIVRIQQQPSDPELERQNDAKLGELSSLRNILSPIRRVPLEILSHIFEIHCPTSSKQSPEFPHLWELVQYISMLSRVCVAWRNAVLATPRLLSRIFISTLDKHNHVKTEDALSAEADWIEQWIPRSKGVPLNLDLDFRYTVSRESRIGIRTTTKLVKNLIPFRIQIQSLHLAGYPRSFLPLFRLPSSSFPLLEDLSLRIFSYESYRDVSRVRVLHEKSEVFCGAPLLRSVKITDDADVSFLESLVLPLEQLTLLKLDAFATQMDPAIYFDAICRCSENLVSLDIRLPGNFEFSVSTSVRLLLPKLKVLSTFSDELRRRGTNLLSILTSPSLEELTLRMTDRYNLWVEVSAFQERSAVTLRSLTVINIYNYDVGNVIELFPVLPTLTSLRFQNPSHHWNRFFRALLCTEESTVLLPKLTNLEVDVAAYLPPLDYPLDLTAMVLSRWWSDVDKNGGQLLERNGVRRLERVTLKRFRYHDDISKLEGLSGLDVHLELIS